MGATTPAAGLWRVAVAVIKVIRRLRSRGQPDNSDRLSAAATIVSKPCRSTDGDCCRNRVIDARQSRFIIDRENIYGISKKKTEWTSTLP